MDTSLSSNGGGVVSVRKYSTTFNAFCWYFLQTLTVSFMLLMVLSIYYAAFAASANIRVVCVITVAFAIISPSFIIPKLPHIAVVALPIFELNKNVYIQVLNLVVWIVCGNLYPFPAHLLCYSLMAGVGLFKLYSTDGGPSSANFVTVIGGDALGISGYMFNHEIKDGTGRWVDSSTGCALLGLFVVTMLAHYLPPLEEPEKKKKKKKMMNEIEAISIEVGSEKKKVVVNVDHVVAEAPIPRSGGTKSFLERIV